MNRRPSPETPIFYGGINVYLQQKFAFFRHTPRWLDKLLNMPALLRLAGRQSGMTDGAGMGRADAFDVARRRRATGEGTRSTGAVAEGKRKAGRGLAFDGVADGLARRIKDGTGRAVCLARCKAKTVFSIRSLSRGGRAAGSARGARARRRSIYRAEPFLRGFDGRRMQPCARRIAPGHSQRNFARRDSAGHCAAEPPVIGYLARFIEGKGLGLVVDAFIELKKRGRVFARAPCAARAQ